MVFRKRNWLHETRTAELQRRVHALEEAIAEVWAMYNDFYSHTHTHNYSTPVTEVKDAQGNHSSV
jgi:hypothetical protein